MTGKPIGKSALDGKTVVKLFTQDGVRKLLIPSKEPNYYPLVLSNDEAIHLKQVATKVEPKDPEKERAKLAEESRLRKEKFKEMDAKAIRKSNKLSDLEQEAKEKANYVLQKAWELRMEQDDDVKAANSLILQTKCQAIRDAQLAERALIKKKMQEEEQREEKQIEAERLRLIIEEKRKLETRKAFKDKYVNELTRQVGEVRLEKQMDFEKIIEERKRLNEAMNMMMMDEVRKLKNSQAQKEKTRKELSMANEQIRKAKLMEREEARLSDLKVQEWMKQRAAREEALEREQEAARRRKELETARLRAMQEKTNEMQELQEQMLAVRRQENYEREWRRKELEAAMKKKTISEECLKVRVKQMEDMKMIQAKEMAREKREWDRIMKKLEEDDKKEGLKRLEHKRSVLNHRATLLRQMNEREAGAFARRKDDIEEGIAMRAEADKRVKDVERVLKMKLEQMKSHKVPELYINDIARQLNLSKDE